MMLPMLNRTFTALCGFALAVAPVFADGSINETIGNGLAAPSASSVTIFTAKKVLTMERANPEATAVAVMGGL